MVDDYLSEASSTFSLPTSNVSVVERRHESMVSMTTALHLEVVGVGGGSVEIDDVSLAVV